jgi:prevent-host-death family protein
MPYTVHQAKTHLSRLLKEAEAGQEVVVTRGKKPVAKIVPITGPEPEAEKLPFRLIGAYRGKISWDDDAFDPLTDEQLKEYGFDALLEGDLVPPPEKQ